MCVGVSVWLVWSGIRVAGFNLQHGYHSNPTTPKLQHTRTKNNTTNVVIQQNSRRLLMMDILMSETCWALKKWNKIASDIKLVFYSSTITMMRGPVNIRSVLAEYLCLLYWWQWWWFLRNPECICSRNRKEFYVLLTIHPGMSLVNNQLDTQFFMYVYFYSLHVLGSHVPIIRRIIVSVCYRLVCRLNLHTRWSSTQSDINKVSHRYNNSPDDGHMAARNM